MSGISKRKIASNIFFLTSSQGTTWIMTLVYTIIVPRYLGPEGVGVLAIGLAVSNIILVVASLGNGTFILKEIARDETSAYHLVGTAILNNSIIGMFSWLVVIIISMFLNISTELRQVLIIYAWTNLLQLATTPIVSALRGLEKMQYSLIDSIISKGILTGLGILFAVLQFNVTMVALASLVAVIPATFLNYWWFFKHSRTTFLPSTEQFKKVIKGGMAFFVIEVTFQIYLYLDALMLSFMTNETTVGYYNVPTNLFGTLLFVPVIIGNAILPALSRLAQQDPDNHTIMTRNTLSFFACISLPMASGATVIAAPLITLLYDKQFQPSIPVFIILAWTAIPTYLGIGIVQALVAQDRQALWSKINIIATIVNLFINFILILLTDHFLQNGAIGAAASLLLCEIIITSVGFSLLTKGTINRQFWTIPLKSLLATGIMVLIIFPLREMFLLLPIVVGMIVYALAIVALGVIPRSYLKLALSLPNQLRKKPV